MPQKGMESLRLDQIHHGAGSNIRLAPHVQSHPLGIVGFNLPERIVINAPAWWRAAHGM